MKTTPTAMLTAARKGDHRPADFAYRAACTGGRRTAASRRLEWCGKIAGLVARNDYATARQDVRAAINCGVNLPQSYRAV